MIQYKGKFVCLDLETTGLDSAKDDIIEIAAVKYAGGKKQGEFNMLVNPQRKLPFIAHAITHISDEDLATAPVFADVREQLREFLGDYPILGQNIQFDIGFLRAKGIVPLENVQFDTRLLAGMVLPRIPALNLEALALHFRFPYENAHRALADVYMTIKVFDRLVERLAGVDAGQLEAISSALATAPEWQFAEVFERALARARKRKEVAGAQKLFDNDLLKPAAPAVSSQISSRVSGLFGEGEGVQLVNVHPLVHDEWETVGALAADASARTLVAADGAFFRSLKQKYANQVSENVVFLNTLAQYVCPERVRLFVKKPRLTNREANFAARLLLWLDRTQTGDLDELNSSFEEQSLSRLVAADNLCVEGKCASALSGCFARAALDRACAARVVVGSHQLLTALAPLAPASFERALIYAAEECEETIARAASRAIDARVLLELLDLVASDAVVDSAAGSAPSAGTGSVLAQLAKDLKTDVLLGLSMIAIAAKDAGAPDATGSKYAQQVVVDLGLRARPHWRDGSAILARASVQLLDLHHQLLAAATAIDTQKTPDHRWRQELLMHLAARASEQASEISALLDQLESRDACTSVILAPNGDVTITQMPVRIDVLLQTELYRVIPRILWVSAAAGSTRALQQFLQSRLGITGEVVQLPPAPSTTPSRPAPHVVIAKDAPSPNSPEFTKRLGDVLRELAPRLLGAGAQSPHQILVLSPSISLIQSLYPLIYEELVGQQISLLADGVTGSASKMIEKAKARRGNLILGASAFWDRELIAACAPDVIIIPKLPFLHPGNFLAKARQDQYRNGFQEFVMPSVAQKIAQVIDGLALLSPGAEVVVFDRRICEGYAQTIYDLLPQSALELCTVDNLVGDILT